MNTLFMESNNEQLLQQLNRLQKTVDELQCANETLVQMANHDPLTGVLNRRGLESVLEREISISKRQKTNLSAALIDLDNFKQVNDTKGHLTGDLVLKVVTERLKSSLRSSDYLFRVGGDEFLLLMPFTDTMEGVSVAERLRAKVCESSIQLENNSQLDLTVSCGVSEVSNSSSTEDILSLTQAALKRSKSAGKNCVSTTNRTEHLVVGMDEMEIREFLISGSGFDAVSQAIVSLQDQIEPLGLEYFVRCTRAPFIFTSDLFRIARMRGLQTTVDLNSMRACIKRARMQSDILKSGSQAHININPSTLCEVPADKILEIFEPLAPDMTLCLELSERQFVMEPSYLKDAVSALKKRGVKIAIDNVCYGHSPLESLILLQPDYIKLDGARVSNIGLDRNKQDTVRKLVKVARVLGASVIAQDIETENEYECLKSLSVEFGQGFFFGAKI